MSNKHLFLVFAALACSKFLIAQDSTVRQLDEVVVTATKYPIKQSLTGKVLTVIRRDQLDKSSGLTIGELLNQQSGIIINGSENTPGTNQSVYVQGADAGKTLILIDGIPAYDPSGTNTAFDINLISTDQVERIEILKGSQSTLYGSDAVAGVINIITRKGYGKRFNAFAGLSGGSYGTYKGSFGINGQVQHTTYAIQYTKLKSDGISSAYDSTGKMHFDNDGLNENTVLVNVSQQIGSQLSVRATFQANNYHSDLDASAFTDDRNFTTASTNYIAGACADYKLGVAVLHLNYNYNTIKRTYLDDSVAGVDPDYSYGSYSGWSHYAELYTNIPLSKHLDLLVGGDFRKQITGQHYLSISPYGPYETDLGKDSATINQLAAYASLILKDVHGFNVELGGRYNHFSQYGKVLTYSFNPSYVINDEVKLFANISSGFIAPTLYQLFSEYRNPTTTLKPEKSVSFEGGVQFSRKIFTGRAVYFVRNVSDNIIFYTDANFNSYYINLDKQKDHGLELEASLHPGRVRLSANYTYLTGKVQTQVNAKDTSFNNLYRRPKNTLNVNAGIQISQRIFTGFAFHALGKREEYVYGSAPAILSAYYTVDAYLEYKLGKQFTLFADLKNITNQQYFDLLGYTSKRFNIMAGVNIRL